MIEHTILSNLIYNKDYSKKVFPYLKQEYFTEPYSSQIFDSVHDYITKYNEPPSKESLKILIDKRKDLDESGFKSVIETVSKLSVDKETNQDWLVNETEKFCQDRALHNSIRKSILILDGQEKVLDKGSIPKLLSDALGISFDSNLGHNFLSDYESRYEYYHKEESRLPFDIDLLNLITQGGLPPKSLTAFLGTTGAGKSLVMGHMAAANLMHGKNVLYVTLELAEEEIARRIDANLMDVTVKEVSTMDKETYDRRIARIKNKTTGTLIIKEYPTTTMTANHLRHALNELKMKEGFVPHIIYIDYINLCASSRVKNTSANSYTIIKSIAEEIRGLAMECNLPIVTATQANRTGYENSDVGLTDTSESMGLPFSLDAFFALITNEELENMGQLMIKQLKNRWGDIGHYKRFVVGIERAKMKLYNLEESAQKNVQNEPTLKEEDTFSSTKKKTKKFSQLNGEQIS